MKRTTASRWFLAGLVLIGLAGWAVTGLLLYARMAYVGLFLGIGAGIWTLFSMRGIHLIRQARILRASMGEIFEEHFEVRNSAWLTCNWLEILNKSNLPLAGGSRLLTGIGSHQRRFYTSRTLLNQRGAFLLGPTALASGDPFGIFTIHKQVGALDTLVVLPMTVQIKDFPPPPGILPGGRAIRQRSADVTPHAAGIREYVPGDPMKRIHWPTTAHRGRFMVKEFEQDPQADIWFFLDGQKEVQASLPEQPVIFSEEGWWHRRLHVSLPRDTFEYVVSSAASLANYFLLDKRAVGLACSGMKSIVVPAERGERQVNKIMETLAFLRADGLVPLHWLVTTRAKLLPIGTGVILVTPSVRPDVLSAVEELQRRNLRPVVVLIKPESFGGTGQSDSILTGLMQRNVPVCPVSLGDDLSLQLALPVVYLQQRFQRKSFFAMRN
jgi:uncharacterized protein (DUF58 family)